MRKSIFIAAMLISAVAHSALYTANISNYIMDGDDNLASIDQRIQNLKSDDTLFIEINSGGGEVVPIYKMMSDMLSTKGHIVAHVTHQASSAAAILAIFIKDVSFDKDSFAVLHMPKMGFNKDGTPYRPFGEPKFDNDVKIFKMIYGPVLTDDEYTIVFTQGKDLKLNGPELERRIKNPNWRSK